MKVTHNASLNNYSTFGIDAIAKVLIEINQESDFAEFKNLMRLLPKPFYFIGSGANTLFSKNYEGTIIHINTKGIFITEEDDSKVIIQAKAGEIWDDFVTFCIENQYYGIENLVAIPGTVGAAPIQNIGAYGMEVGNVIQKIDYIDLQDFTHNTINRPDCQFAYRQSIFKNNQIAHWVVTAVTFQLSKKSEFILNYGKVAEELSSRQIIAPRLQDVAMVIRDIRNSKLPDYKIFGNAGSFFKNPVISNPEFEKIKSLFPDIVHFPDQTNRVKIAAGWLIEKAGLKGYQHGGAMIHQQQALVIINYNHASGTEILELARIVQTKVFELFEIRLEPEVIIL
jgi:UDP-N-acetylmuramate dehydrogenase